MQEIQQAYRGCRTAQWYEKHDYYRIATTLSSPAATQWSPARRTPLDRMGKTRAGAGQHAASQQLVAMGLSAPSDTAMGKPKEWETQRKDLHYQEIQVLLPETGMDSINHIIFYSIYVAWTLFSTN